MQRRRKYFLANNITGNSSSSSNKLSREEEDQKDLKKIIDFFTNRIVMSKEFISGNRRIYRCQSHTDFINDYFMMINKQMLKSEMSYVMPSLHEMILNIPGLASKMIIDIDFKPKSTSELNKISSVLFRNEIQFQNHYELMGDERNFSYNKSKTGGTNNNRNQTSFNQKILFNFIIKNIVKLLKELVGIQSNKMSMSYEDNKTPPPPPEYFKEYIGRFSEKYMKSHWINPYSLDDLLSSMMIIFSASNTKKKSFHIYLPRILADMKIDMALFNKCLSVMCYLDNPFLLFGIPYESIHPKCRNTEEFINENEKKEDFHRKLWEYYCIRGGGTTKKKKSPSSPTIEEDGTLFATFSSSPSSSLLNEESRSLLNEICTTYPIVDIGPYTSMRMHGSSKLHQFRPMKLIFPNTLPNHIELKKYDKMIQCNDTSRKRLEFIRSSEKSFIFDILNNKSNNESFQKYVIRQTLIHSNGKVQNQKETNDDDIDSMNQKIKLWNENAEKMCLCAIQMPWCQKNTNTNEYEFMHDKSRDDENFKFHMNHDALLKMDKMLMTSIGDDALMSMPLNCFSKINRSKFSSILSILNIEAAGICEGEIILDQMDVCHDRDREEWYESDEECHDGEDDDTDGEDDAEYQRQKRVVSLSMTQKDTNEKYIVSGGGSLIKKMSSKLPAFDFRNIDMKAQEKTSTLSTDSNYKELSMKPLSSTSVIDKMKKKQEEDNRFLLNELKLNKIKPRNVKNKKMLDIPNVSSSPQQNRTYDEFNDLKCKTLVKFPHIGNDKNSIEFLFKCIAVSLPYLFYPLKWPIKQLYIDNKFNEITLSIDHMTNTKTKDVYVNGSIEITIKTNGYLSCPWKYIRLSCANRDITNLKPESKFNEKEKNEILMRQNRKEYCHDTVDQLYIKLTVPLDKRKTGGKFSIHCFHTECKQTEFLNRKKTNDIQNHKYDYKNKKQQSSVTSMNPDNIYPIHIEYETAQNLRTLFFNEKLKKMNMNGFF